MDTIASWSVLKQKDSQVLNCKLSLCITANMVYLEAREGQLSLFQCLQYAVSVYRGKIVMTNTEVGKLASILYAADNKSAEEADNNLE
jgi:hypothetical protein